MVGYAIATDNRCCAGLAFGLLIPGVEYYSCQVNEETEEDQAYSSDDVFAQLLAGAVVFMAPVVESAETHNAIDYAIDAKCDECEDENPITVHIACL